MKNEFDRGDTRPRTPQQELLRVLHHCGRFVYHRVHGARGQSSVLRILAENPRITQKELLGLLHVQPGSLSEILTKLENKGLIVRAKDEEDKRKVLVAITEEGQRAVGDTSDELTAEELFAALDEGEQRELTRLLTKVAEDWDVRYGRPEHQGRRGRRPETDDRREGER